MFMKVSLVISDSSQYEVSELDGMPQDFPDFTRGQWKTTKLGIVQ